MVVVVMVVGCVCVGGVVGCIEFTLSLFNLVMFDLKFSSPCSPDEFFWSTLQYNPKLMAPGGSKGKLSGARCSYYFILRISLGKNLEASIFLFLLHSKDMN